MRGRREGFFYAPGDEGRDGQGTWGLIEEQIANVAAVFHWPLSEFAAMDLEELAMWSRLAVDRWNTMNRVE
ncbi:GpE family phage tail protein [Sphingomonas sp. IC081]|uniref:GpE family phage tail protein n=1 Tax=Sphingomonas sp. IC081 TaxID=304378 RepID=UPI0028B1728E|nr:GpE family phage tail protein [Sphingomonas sp. IC081]